MRRIAIFAVYLIVLACAVTPASAADKVTVRTGVHDGYTRIVFAWPSAPKYTAKQSGTTLTLNFTNAATFSISGKAPSALPRISGFSTTPQSATIEFAAGQSVREFVIGSRLIVDIQGKPVPPAKTTEPVADKKPPEKVADAKPAETKKPEPEKAEPAKPAEEKPAPVAVVAPEKPKPVEVKPAEPAPTPADQLGPPPVDEEKTAQSVTPEMTPAPKPAAVVPATAPPKLDAHMINITATQAIGVAAFERFGTLWIVLDKPDYPIFPQVAGPQKASFPPFDRIALKDGTIFKLKIPAGLNTYGEGGGLVWKIVLTPTARKTSPLGFERSFDQTKKPGGSLLWKTLESRQIIEFTDPEVGDTLKAVTVSSSRDLSGAAQDYPEFSTLDTITGLVIRPKIDDLMVTRETKGVVLTTANGLALSPETDLASLKLQQKENDESIAETPDPVTTSDKPADPANPFSKIFSFDRWQMGGPEEISENQRIIMSALAGKTDQGKAEDLMTLAKMELANGRGPEALGYVDFAGDIVKDLTTTPEFLALRGAAEALTGQHDRGFKDFSDKALEPITEIKFWRAFTLANLEDWKQADTVLPKDVSILNHYPQPVRMPVGLTLAEVALRAGDTDTADKILEILARDEEKLPLAQAAGLEYLRGESRRQQGDFDGMKKMWEPLANGPDDMYRAKAGLALTSQLLDKKEITAEKAIDKLEGLRYAWRGDELETAINYKLGRIYMDSNQPIKGLTLLRQAASLAPGSDLGRSITAYMTEAFKNLFLTDKVKVLNPIDALTIYDEFSELIPTGEDGDKVARQLAERLVDADLLPRAENLLQNQIDTRLNGMQGAEVALRLASIQILDGKPDKALDSLNRAGEFLLSVPLEAGAPKRREISLLRARALADQKKPEEAFAALALLQQDGDVLRLRADIAWRSKRWQDASDSLEQLVAQSNLDLTKPLNDEQAANILNWAVALYLADNRYVLANLREKYSDPMAQTPLAKKFDVVTRPRQNSLLADRNTINSIIGETDIFKGFLDKVGAAKPLGEKPATGAATPAVPQPVKPVAGE